MCLRHCKLGKSHYSPRVLLVDVLLSSSSGGKSMILHLLLLRLFALEIKAIVCHCESIFKILKFIYSEKSSQGVCLVAPYNGGSRNFSQGIFLTRGLSEIDWWVGQSVVNSKKYDSRYDLLYSSLHFFFKLIFRNRGSQFSKLGKSWLFYIFYIYILTQK